MPLPRHAINDLTVIHKVSGNVSTSDACWLFPGQYHGVTHTLQDSDAIGWSGRGWERRLKLTPWSLSRATDVMGNWSTKMLPNVFFTAAHLLQFILKLTFQKWFYYSFGHIVELQCSIQLWSLLDFIMIMVKKKSQKCLEICLFDYSLCLCNKYKATARSMLA